MSIHSPILVTGAAGRVGGVGRAIVEMLRQRNLPVRALVRREDKRSDELQAMGAEVLVGDLGKDRYEHPRLCCASRRVIQAK